MSAYTGLAALGFMAGMVFAVCVERSIWREDCIKRGHAEYNATTGAWQWKTPSPGEKGDK